MAKLGIFTGTSPNDSSGDTLSQGAVKINSNFSEIYNAIGDGTNITNTIAFANTAGIATNVIGGIASVTNLSSGISTITTLGVTGLTTTKNLQVIGITTFTNGPLLIGLASSTGTALQRLQITGGAYVSGNLGIGTTNPSFVTDIWVSGNTELGLRVYNNSSQSSASSILRLGNDLNSNAAFLRLNGSGNITSVGGTDALVLGHGLDRPLVFSNAGLERGRFDTGGNLGIGTTNPTEKLSVYGAVESLYDTIGEGGQFILRGKTGTPIRWNIDNYSVGLTTNLFRIFKEDDSTAASNGRVYVGITTIGEFIIGDSAGAVLPTKTANQQLQVQSGAYIQNNLGIGTTNPQYKLDVSGDIRSSGTIYGNVATAITAINVINGIASVTNLSSGISTITTLGVTGLSTTKNLQVTGISTFTNGPILVGRETTTGTENQALQVESGAYVSGNLGIGTINPTSSLSVNGSTVIGTQILDMTGLSSTFTTVGSNTFTVPAGVTKISAVLIGGGGAGGGGSIGAFGPGGQGGGGGGLAYINDYPVTPGQSLTVIVGAGGQGGFSDGTDGENSEITGIVTAFGGKGGTANNTGTATGLGGSGTIISGGTGNTFNGGTGGTATLTTGAGGGGAAGYSGNGGNGGNGSIINGGAAGSGGAAGGGGSPTASGSGGGGVSVFGQGGSGAVSNGAGNSGSGGDNGSVGNGRPGAAGGNYGGGGGGADGNSGFVSRGGNGAQGIVRIIWSPNSKFSRLFPTNQVGNSINQ